MKKIFTILLSLLTISAFAATEPAWYNDVTSITANGQYYIYSPKGAGFMQAGQTQVKAINQNNYNTTSGLLFTVDNPSGGPVHSGNKYLYSYQASLSSACGPVYSNGDDAGTKIIWTLMNNGAFWNIHSLYDFLGNRYAALYYTGSKYDAVVKDKSIVSQDKKETYTDEEYRWYVISQAHYDRHWAIYLYDRYKESISDYTKWENLVPAAYYTALTDAYAVTYNVKNAEHSKEVVNAHRADLKALYDNAEAVADAYANAKTVINALEAVEDKGEDFAEVTTGITAARTAIEAAMSVDALNAAVSAPALKAIDPITFSVTEFTAINPVEGAAASVAGRAIAYDAADKTIINAEGKAVYAGTTTLTATAEATEQYYKFVRSAQVTVTAPTTYGDFEEHSCDTPVEFNGQTYDASFAGDIKVGLNYMGGDSIVHVNIVINHASFGADELEMTYGEEKSWHGFAFSEYAVGTYELKDTLENAVGCDSIVTLTLTVNKQETLNVPVELEFCAGDSAEFRGKWYFSAEDSEEISAEGATRDTLYVINVTVLQPSFGTEELTMYVGEEIEWNGIALKDSTVGAHTVIYETTNVVGCDSTVTLSLTVLERPTTYGEYEAKICEGDSVEFAGKWYFEATQENVTLEEKNSFGGDSIVALTVTMLPVYAVVEKDTVVQDSIYEWQGETLTTSKLGTFEYTKEYTSVEGCDSIITLYLTVVEPEIIEPEDPTGLEQIEAMQKAVKEFRNGVLYIRREGKEFTLDGRLVK